MRGNARFIDQFDALLRTSVDRCARSGHRLLIIATGPFAAQASTFAQHPDNNVLSLTANNGKQDISDRIQALLGEENPAIHLDINPGTHPGLLAAGVGTVPAGGWILLSIPALTTEPDASSIAPYLAPSLFWKRFVQCMRNELAPLPEQPGLWTLPVMTEATLPGAPEASRHHSPSLTHPATLDWQQEQDTLLRAISTALQTRHDQVVIIQADRGRGKSALLGRVAAACHQAGKPVMFCAARRSNLTTVARHWYADTEQPGNGRHITTALPYVTVEQALSQRSELLFVDEASSLPLPVLQQLARQHRQLVVATTVQGYEGAGRGFALRFTRQLDSQTKRWQRYSPTCPIRWSADDPVEALFNRVLLLGVDWAAQQDSTPCARSVTERKISRAELASNDTLLRQVFGLLTQAHYQTTPRDLQHLLDAPQLSLWASLSDGAVVAVLLASHEGPIADSLHHDIMARRRRPPHALTPQLLAHSLGCTSPLTARYLRVVRIAVQPSLQRSGLGSSLLAHVEQETRGHLDAHSASFGADTDTLAFWAHNGFQPVHHGFRRNARSGLRSSCVLKAHTTLSQRHQQTAAALLADNVGAWMGLSDVLHNTIDAKVMRWLEHHLLPARHPRPPAREDDLRRIRDFVTGCRNLHDTAAALRRWQQRYAASTLSTTHLQSPDWHTLDWLEQLMVCAEVDAVSGRARERQLQRWLDVMGHGRND